MPVNNQKTHLGKIYYVEFQRRCSTTNVNLPVKPRTARRVYSKEACENGSSVLPTIPWQAPAINYTFLRKNINSTILTELTWRCPFTRTRFVKRKRKRNENNQLKQLECF